MRCVCQFPVKMVLLLSFLSSCLPKPKARQKQPKDQSTPICWAIDNDARIGREVRAVLLPNRSRTRFRPCAWSNTHQNFVPFVLPGRVSLIPGNGVAAPINSLLWTNKSCLDLERLLSLAVTFKFKRAVDLRSLLGLLILGSGTHE